MSSVIFWVVIVILNISDVKSLEQDKLRLRAFTEWCIAIYYWLNKLILRSRKLVTSNRWWTSIRVNLFLSQAITIIYKGPRTCSLNCSIRFLFDSEIFLFPIYYSILELSMSQSYINCCDVLLYYIVRLIYEFEKCTSFKFIIICMWYFAVFINV